MARLGGEGPRGYPVSKVQAASCAWLLVPAKPHDFPPLRLRCGKGDAELCPDHAGIVCSNKGCRNPAIGECLERSADGLYCKDSYCEDCGQHTGEHFTNSVAWVKPQLAPEVTDPDARAELTVPEQRRAVLLEAVAAAVAAGMEPLKCQFCDGTTGVYHTCTLCLRREVIGLVADTKGTIFCKCTVTKCRKCDVKGHPLEPDLDRLMGRAILHLQERGGLVCELYSYDWTHSKSYKSGSATHDRTHESRVLALLGLVVETKL